MKGIVVKNLTKELGGNKIIKNLSFTIPENSFCTITGKSGSGKSTLLYLLSSLDEPTFGEIWIDDKNISSISEEELHIFRNQNIGFVFQFHHLLPELTALENVLIPALKLGQMKNYEEQAKHLLAEVGLKDKFQRFPAKLSGGEQQRVAIARSLIMSPRYIFADEPTGNLDSTNGMAVMELFQRFNKEKNTTIIYVTHDKDYARLANYTLELIDGKLANS